MAGKKHSKGYRTNHPEEVTGKSLVITIVVFILALLAVFIFLNDNVLKLDGLPTTRQILRGLGFGSSPYVETVDGEISVHFIDVGQGDSELIVAQGYNVLIDCGERDRGADIIRYLKYLGIEKLDYVILTHPHSDHIGGAYSLLSEIEVERLIMPFIPDDVLPETVAYNNLLDGIEEYEILCSYANAGEQIFLGTGTYLEILAPLYDDYEDLNNYSIVAKLVHGENSFLFTGDIEEDAEIDILEAECDVSADVLKVAHHGSNTSSSTDFLDAVSPKYAVISAGSDNSYGHPHVGTLARLKAIDCEFYVTMECGNIVFVSDGEKLEVYTSGDIDYSESEAA